MTVKKRLFWSNILMILIPVIATVLIGLVCVGFIGFALIHGMEIGIQDQDEFEVACTAISEGMKESLKKESDFSSVQAYAEGLLDGVAKTQEAEHRYFETIKAKAGDLEAVPRAFREQKAPSEITLGGIRPDTGTHRVFVDGAEVELKNKEYELLLFLMPNPCYIETVWGAGYRFRG